MTRMQVLAVTLGAALQLTAIAPLQAQDSPKIGYVNVQFLLQNAPQTQAMEQTLVAEFSEREAEFSELLAEYEEERVRYERNIDVLTEAERSEGERDILRRERELERLQQELQEDVNFRRDELLGQLQSTVGALLQEFVEAEGYDIVVSNVVYVSPDADITVQAIDYVTAQAESE